MKKLLIFFITLSFAINVNSQICASLDNWSLSSDNGDGTCTYNLSIIVDSGNGASGTATFSLGGVVVYTQTNCTCNPTTISFPVTVQCGSTILIEVYYDAPGNGNDCTGNTGNIVLPIEWHTISVSNEGIKNNLIWSTQSEVNNSKFIIEHSKATIDFNEIGEVKGSGLSFEISNYSFLHMKPTSGINYYRIKQVDYDGNYSYSKIVSTMNEVEDFVQIHPNPFDETINIIAEDTNIKWALLDIYGNTILNGSSYQISTNTLIAGTYIIKIMSDSKFQQKIVVKL